ncbi:MAG: hypothetical protein ACKO1J_00800 [Tagaea sp.]
MNLTDPPEKSFGSNGATAKRDESGRFLSVPGNSPNAGRKKGARARWSEEFMADVEAAWKEQGPTVIARAMFHDPAGTLKALIGILPKHAKLEISTPTDGMTDEQLERLIAYAEAKIAEASTVEGRTITVTPSLPPPLAEAPSTSAEQRAEAVRRDMLDQSDAANAAAPKLPSQALPHPVGRPFPAADHDVERINRAKLHDDINREDLF